jgi:transposase
MPSILDQAGWHLSKRLKMPTNTTLLPLPPKCPELNPVENIWQFMRDNWLPNLVFTSYSNLVDHCCHAWNSPHRPTLNDFVHRPG